MNWWMYFNFLHLRVRSVNHWLIIQLLLRTSENSYFDSGKCRPENADYWGWSWNGCRFWCGTQWSVWRQCGAGCCLLLSPGTRHRWVTPPLVTLPLTSYCPSLSIAPHYTLPLTSRCPSLHTAPHFTLPCTSHCPSLHAAPHFTLPCTSCCPSLHAVSSHWPSLPTAPHFMLPLTTRCPSLHTASHFTLRSSLPFVGFCVQFIVIDVSYS